MIVRTVWAKELLDAIRDPRALLYLVGLPLVFYPGLLLLLELLARSMMGAPPVPPYTVAVAESAGVPLLTAVFVEEDDLLLVPAENALLEVAEGRVAVGIAPDPGYEDALAAGIAPRLALYTNLGVPGADEIQPLVHQRMAAYESALAEVLVTGPPGGRGGRGPGAGRPPTHLAVTETVIGDPLGDVSFMVGLFPYFLVVLVLVGAAHMAIDVTAGEKERRTLETLLVTSADRGAILAGKALATVTASVGAGGLGMLGFALAIALADPLTGGRPVLLALEPRAFWILGAASVPTACFLSALLLTLGTVARSSREGQTYAAYLQMPLLLLALGATWVDGTDRPGLFLVPLMGMNLMQKEYLFGMGDPTHAAVAVAATLAATLLFGLLAARAFTRESVLFRG